MYIAMRRENEVGLQQTRMKLRRHEERVKGGGMEKPARETSRCQVLAVFEAYQ